MSCEGSIKQRAYCVDGLAAAGCAGKALTYEIVACPAAKVGRQEHDQVRQRLGAAQRCQVGMQHLHTSAIFSECPVT